VSRPDKISLKITQLLQKNHTLTAPQLIKFINDSGQSVNKTSVYRAIERLIVKNEICRHMFGGQIAVYELRSHDHDHLVCSHCGQVLNIPNLIEIPQYDQGWQISHHHLTLFGVCPNCSDQMEKSDQLPTDRPRSARTKLKRQP